MTILATISTRTIAEQADTRRGIAFLGPEEKTHYMITELINAILGLWGGVFAGSSGYEVPPGVLPFGS